MIEADRAEFCRSVAAVYALYRVELSDAVLWIWWEAMRGLELEAVRVAIGRHAMNPDSGMFLPKPADVVRELGGTTADASMLAWAAVVNAMRRVGTYESVAFDDPIVHRVLVDLGGWPWLGEQLELEMPFIERRFRDAYRAWLRRGLASADVPKHLPGRTEIQNVAAGYLGFVPAPVAVGSFRRFPAVGTGTQPAVLTSQEEAR